MLHLPSCLKPYKKLCMRYRLELMLQRGSRDCKLQHESNLKASLLQTFTFSLYDIGDWGNTQVKKLKRTILLIMSLP